VGAPLIASRCRRKLRAGHAPRPSPPQSLRSFKKGAVQTRRPAAPDPFWCGCQAQKSSLGKKKKTLGNARPRDPVIAVSEPNNHPDCTHENLPGAWGYCTATVCSCRYQRVAPPGRSGCRLGRNVRSTPSSNQQQHTSSPRQCVVSTSPLVQGRDPCQRAWPRTWRCGAVAHHESPASCAVRASTGPPTAARGLPGASAGRQRPQRGFHGSSAKLVTSSPHGRTRNATYDGPIRWGSHPEH